MKTKFLVLALCLIAPLSAAADTSQTGWRLDGFEMPESALYDPARNRIIVSNIVGHPGEADGVGHLSLVTTNGALIERRWARGLDAPKGMALVGDRLLVADLTALRVLDAQTGAILQTIRPKGAVFLNDVAAGPDGTVFVTDFMDHAIYRFQDGALTLWLRDPALQHPNGVLVDGDRLVVGSWGAGVKEDFTTATPGGLAFVDLQTKAIAPVPGAERIGNIDGVVRIGEALIFSDWVSGDLYSWTTQGGVRRERTAPKGLADIGVLGSRLLAPLMLDGVVESWPFSAR